MNERFLNYNPPISKELRQMHEQALANEYRWLNGRQISDIPESDLDHVKSMYAKDLEVEIKYPMLHSEVASEDRLHMFYIHDTGELLAHDLSHSVPNYDLLRPKVKRREAAAFRLLTKKYISDTKLRADARLIYKRYEQKDPQDKVAQYVNLIDKTQATEFGVRYVFPARKLKTKAARQQQLNHIYGLHIDPAVNLFRLVGCDAQNELLDFLDDHFMMFQENGYRRDEVGYYRSLMRNTLNSYRDTAFR